jgi:hypothetical protein
MPRAITNLGFLIVPSRPRTVHLDVEALGELARKDRLVLQLNGKPRNKGGVASTLISLALAAVTRGATTWFSKHLGQVAETWSAEGSQPGVPGRDR